MMFLQDEVKSIFPIFAICFLIIEVVSLIVAAALYKLHYCNTFCFLCKHCCTAYGRAVWIWTFCAAGL